MSTIQPSDPLSAFVEAYEPTHLSPSTWQSIAVPVRASAVAAASTRDALAKVLPVLACFAAWLQSEGYCVDFEIFQDVVLIDRYIQTGMTGSPDSTRATRRAILRRVAHRLDPSPPPALEEIRYRRAKAPYREWELAGFFDQAATQPTLARRRAVLGVLLLGSACGLDQTDLAWVRGSDVAVGPDVVVTVGGGSRPRTVVALDDYADAVAEAASWSGEDLLIGGKTLGRHNVTTPALDRMVADSRLPRLSTSRLRSTWLVRHLDLATPLSVLLPAAGLKSSRTLDDLLVYSLPVPHSNAVRMLRGVFA